MDTDPAAPPVPDEAAVDVEPTDFTHDLTTLLNRYCAESPSGTPDFILGEFLRNVLREFNEAVSRRAEWRGETVELPALAAAPPVPSALDTFRESVAADLRYVALVERQGWEGENLLPCALRLAAATRRALAGQPGENVGEDAGLVGRRRDESPASPAPPPVPPDREAQIEALGLAMCEDDTVHRDFWRGAITTGCPHHARMADLALTWMEGQR